MSSINDKNQLKKRLRPYLCILVGTALMACAAKSAYDPIGLVTGGFTGIGIMVRRLTVGYVQGGIPIWVTNLALNIPMFLLAWKLKGIRFVSQTALADGLLSFWLAVLPGADLAEGDYLLAAIYGGILMGAGVGLVLSSGVATGGSDLIATLVHIKVQMYSIAQILQVIDGAIILAGVYVCGIHSSLYAILAVFVSTKVSDLITEGGKFSKAVYVISEHYDQIAQQVMDEMDRGITMLPAVGMYQRTARHMLYCVVSRKEVVSLKERIRNIDPAAFVIVTDAREVLGEGFIEY